MMMTRHALPPCELHAEASIRGARPRGGGDVGIDVRHCPHHA